MKRQKRKRDYIPLSEKLAAALSMLLSQADRDAMRGAQMPAKAVLSLFQFDHTVFHAPPFNGSDKWWNLTPLQKKPHQEKTRSDISAMAKVNRIIARQAEHQEAMRRLVRSTAPKSRWPKRKIPSRPFGRPC